MTLQKCSFTQRSGSRLGITLELHENSLLLSKVKGVNLNHFLIIKPCTSGSDELISLCMQHAGQMFCD